MKKPLVPSLGEFAISWVKQEAYLIISCFNPAVQNEMGCLREGVNSEPGMLERSLFGEPGWSRVSKILSAESQKIFRTF